MARFFGCFFDLGFGFTLPNSRTWATTCAIGSLALAACQVHSAPSSLDRADDGGVYLPGSTIDPRPVVPPSLIIAPTAADAGAPPPACGNGVLDPGERCDPGLQLCCNTSCDGQLGMGVVCREAQGACDLAEVCDGTRPTCPNDAVVGKGTDCRAKAGQCDRLEVCDGANADCPDDVVVAKDTPCRPIAGACDMVDLCDGENAACPADLRLPNTFVCRNPQAVCDEPELCDGEDVACPPASQTVAQAGTPCRPASGLCDVAEVCGGGGLTDCPTDVFKPSTQVCRPRVSGGCDLGAETCTGSDAACPADVLMPKLSACDDGVYCNGADSCTAGGTCSINAGNPCPGHNAGPSCNDSCDEATDSCSGFDALGSACNDGTFCNGPDACNAIGGCAFHTGNPCLGQDTGPNCNDSCNEAADLCNANDANATACDDSNACTLNTACAAGVCQGVAAVCNDNAPCTVDTCSPATGCVFTPGNAGTLCRSANAADLCDAPETCNGGSAVCPADTGAALPDGTPCNATLGACRSALCCPGVTDSTDGISCRLAVGEHVVFVTSNDRHGAFSDLASADAFCAAQAQQAGLGGSFRAWLSTSGASQPAQDAKDRISGGPYVRVDGELIATDKADLTDSTLGHPINVTQWTESRDVPVWTGSTGAGIAAAKTCNDWTSNLPTDSGEYGMSNAKDGGWTQAGTSASCRPAQALYCFEVDECPGTSGLAVVDLQTDQDNCGTCGNPCTGPLTCIDGQCI